MADAPDDATQPEALAIPREGYFKREEGRYGVTFPRTPANYGFTIIARIKPGTADKIRSHGKIIQSLLLEDANAFAPLKLHFLRWVLFDIAAETFFMYQATFDTDFDKYTEDAIALFRKFGIDTAFENLEDFPADWKTNVPAFVKFVREHQCPSFLEYAEYPYVTSEEIKKALQVKGELTVMLEQMQ